MWDTAIGWLMRRMQPFLDAYNRVKSGVTWIADQAGSAISSVTSAVLGSRKDGGYIPQTGPYLLHEGETVIPAGSGAGNTFNFNFAGAYIGDKDQFTREIISAIDRESQLKQLGGI